MKPFFLQSLCLAFSFVLTAQTTSSQDLDQSNCLGATVVDLPLDVEGRTDQEPHEVTYGEKDRYTFWYRIEAKEQENLEVTISSTAPEDIYDVSLYHYDGDSICQEVVHGDLTPSAIASLGDNPDEKEVRGHHPVALKKDLEEGIHYLSVLHVGGKGCGHIARFTGGDQRLEVHAKARSCFRLPEEPKPEEEEERKVELRVGLRDEADSSVISGELMVMEQESGKKRFLELERKDGAEKIDVEADKAYRFQGEALGYHDSSMVRSFEKDSSFFLPLKRLEKGERMVLRRIYFHPNTYAFRDESQSSLDALFRFMEENPDRRIEIRGHTASDQSIKKANPLYRDKGKAWNFTGTAQELSELRAEAVKKELNRKGIEGDRMEIRGFGGERKLIENPKNKQEEQQNMRVELRILE